MGLLVYEPQLFTSSEPGAASLDGRLTWVEVERDDEAFLDFLGDVTALLEREETPAAGGGLRVLRVPERDSRADGTRRAGLMARV